VCFAAAYGVSHWLSLLLFLLSGIGFLGAVGALRNKRRAIVALQLAWTGFVLLNLGLIVSVGM